MSDWGFVFAFGLVAAAAAAIGYVRYRQRETETLRADVDLAARLRTAAGSDAVRLAAVDEFETAIYQRLFYAAVIGPRLRAAAWSLLTAMLFAAGVVLFDGSPRTTVTVVWIICIALAVVFALAALVLVVLAAIAAATTPRVSFAESYGGR